MNPFIRYTLLQVPGWLLLGLLLWWAHAKEDWISITTAAWIMAAWIGKDAALYPLCRKAFEKSPAKETEKLIGRTAMTVRPIDPRGLVRLDGELWSARTDSEEPISANTHVRVTAADGLILSVEAAPNPRE